MSVGLYSGEPGLSLGSGLCKTLTGLWGDAPGLITGGGAIPVQVRDVVSANSGSLFVPGPGFMYTASGGNPVVGDLVATLICAAGSGKTATFPSGHRPVLRAYGSSYYLDPNGVDCYGVTDCTGSGIANTSLVGAGSATGNGKIFAGCFRASDSSRSYFGVADGSSAGKIGAGIDGISWATLHAEVGWTTNKVVTVTRSATQAKLYVDGVIADTETISGVGSPLVAYVMAGNGDGTAFDFWTGPWFGLCGTLSTLNDADRAVVEAYFAAILASGA